MATAVENVPPRATDMAEAMRGLGYRTEEAVADLIDNSITARARRIRIEFSWSATRPYITVSDDGHGMTEGALREAMRPGRDPRQSRSETDLGRFGFGLKSASFSQCRSLTVRSRVVGQAPATRRWDLDHIEAAREWQLLLHAAEGAEPALSPLEAQPHGTIVLWEQLDGLLGKNPENNGIDDFWAIADRTALHLGMVFHRFIEDERLAITLNGEAIRPWNPFIVGGSVSQEVVAETIRTGATDNVTLVGYMLPAPGRLTDEQVAYAAGPLGWLEGQGFYVYRNDRLIVSGGWLGLSRAGHPWRIEERYQLARLSLDISNASDLDWGIDVRKTKATPPIAFRRRLTELAAQVREQSKVALRARHRAETTGATPGTASLWIKAGTEYKLNRQHPLALELVKATGSQANLARAFFEILEQSVPVLPQSPLVVDEATQDLVDPRRRGVKQLATTLYYSYRYGARMDAVAALQQLLSQRAFSDYPDIIADVVKQFEGA